MKFLFVFVLLLAVHADRLPPEWGSTVTWALHSSTETIIPYLPVQDIVSAIQRAFDTWSAVIPIDYIFINDFPSANIWVEFFDTQSHDVPPRLVPGDYSFDTHPKEVAHSAIGFLHFDARYHSFTIGDCEPMSEKGGKKCFDLQTIALHEIGHCGVGVRDYIYNPELANHTEGVMYGVVYECEKKLELAPIDVLNAQEIYGIRVIPPPSPTPPPPPPPTPPPPPPPPPPTPPPPPPPTPPPSTPRNQDGVPGLVSKWNRNELTWALHPNTETIIPYHYAADLISSLRRAFATWSAVIPLDFKYINEFSSADIKVGFFNNGTHGGNDLGFADPGNVVHASGPSQNTYMHFNAANFNFSINCEQLQSDGKKTTYYLESIALPGIGHCIGLNSFAIVPELASHTEAIMYGGLPEGCNVTLTPVDVKVAQQIYGARISPPGQNQVWGLLSKWNMNQVTWALHPNTETTIPYHSVVDLVSALQRAFATWSEVVPVDFIYSREFSTANIQIAFFNNETHEAGDLGFSNPIYVLHASLPSQHTYIHFNAASYTFSTSNCKLLGSGGEETVDLETAALVGIGHSGIGLDSFMNVPELANHTEATMYGTIGRCIVELAAIDKEIAQRVYGARIN